MRDGARPTGEISGEPVAFAAAGDELYLALADNGSCARATAGARGPSASGSERWVVCCPAAPAQETRFSPPYFEVPDLSAALAQVRDLGGTVIHPGDRWAICKDSEGSPFGLAAKPTA